MKGLVVGLLLGGLAVAAWMGRERLAPLLRGASVSGLAAPGPHKCLQGSRVLYTDGPCPAGSRMQAVGGQVTVLPGAPAAPPAATASGLPNARQLLVPPEAVDLKAQRMDAVIGR